MKEDVDPEKMVGGLTFEVRIRQMSPKQAKQLTDQLDKLPGVDYSYRSTESPRPYVADVFTVVLDSNDRDRVAEIMEAAQTLAAEFQESMKTAPLSARL